jgi:hypothetical protein
MPAATVAAAATTSDDLVMLVSFNPATQLSWNYSGRVHDRQIGRNFGEISAGISARIEIAAAIDVGWVEPLRDPREELDSTTHDDRA